MNSVFQRRLLLGCLRQLATYLYDRNSELGPYAIGWRGAAERRDELSVFQDELVARHALACGQQFRDVVSNIERRVASTAVVLEEDCRGAVRGRLNTPRYLARRAAYRSLPRTYPVLVNRREPQTPENALVCGCCDGLAAQLASAPFAKNTAEGRVAAVLRDWVTQRLRHEPWSLVRRRDVLNRLLRESDRRIRKRQTGNDAAYSLLANWVREWLADLSKLGVERDGAIVDGLLSFPAGEAFWQKVFEIWCLEQVSSSLARLGWAEEFRRPLHKRDAGPVMAFACGSHRIDVWFQRQLPLGTASWHYDSGDALRGIPDITLTHSAGGAPMIIDAKYRYAGGETRAEETYKILGYAENFRAALHPVWGVLCFVGPAVSGNGLHGPQGGRIVVLRCDEQLHDLAGYGNALDDAIYMWTSAGRQA